MVIHINTPIEPYDESWRESKPLERWQHPAMNEPGVIGEQLRLDQVGARYGLPQRVRTPSARAVIVTGYQDGGVVVEHEQRKSNMDAAFYEPVTWSGGILVHPIDDTWKPSKSALTADREHAAELISRRMKTALRLNRNADPLDAPRLLS